MLKLLEQVHDTRTNCYIKPMVYGEFDDFSTFGLLIFQFCILFCLCVIFDWHGAVLLCNLDPPTLSERSSLWESLCRSLFFYVFYSFLSVCSKVILLLITNPTDKGYYPNAPSGASTAAPVFEDWRLLQLSAFCSLPYLDRILVICFFLRSMFAYFYSYLQVLDVFRCFASCQAALTFCKCCCREATKID